MKKLASIAIPLFLFIVIPVFSQTKAIEYKALENRLLSKDVDQLEYVELIKAWQEMLDSIGYPELPYNPLTEKIEFEYISSIDGISKDIIINRILEWAAISFGSLTEVLHYQDNESGKVILKGSFEIPFPDLYRGFWGVEKEGWNTGTCYFTLVFTIKEGRLKSQVPGISYTYKDYNISGYSSRTVSRSLNSSFPISDNDQNEWKSIMALVHTTKVKLNAQIRLLVNYIEDYENDYSF